MTQSNPFADRIAQAAQEGYVNGNRRTFARPSAASDFPAQVAPKATPKQIALIVSLLAERDLDAETRPKFAARVKQLSMISAEIDNLEVKAASAFIEYLFGLPTRITPAPVEDEFAMIPAGRYGVIVNGEMMFVHVDKPETGKWAGHTFVKRQNGDETVRLYKSVQRRVLNAIATQDPRICSETYGRELGHCGVCGRTLTNAESRAEGIGPICRSKNGW